MDHNNHPRVSKGSTQIFDRSFPNLNNPLRQVEYYQAAMKLFWTEHHSQISPKIALHKLYFWDTNHIVLILISMSSVYVQDLSSGSSFASKLMEIADLILNYFCMLFICLLLSFCFPPTMNRWGTFHTKWRRSFGEWAASGLRASAEFQPGIPASPSRTGVRSNVWGTLLIWGAPDRRDHGWDR